MRSSNILASEKPLIVHRISIADTIRKIQPGTSATFSCRDLQSTMNSVRAVITRLNKEAGRQKYTIKSSDFGETYTIAHLT